MTPQDLTPAHLDIARRAALPFERVIDPEEARSAAHLALVRAACSWNGVGSFDGWAWIKCAGAVREACRREDVARTMRYRTEREAGAPGRRGPSLHETVLEDGTTLADVLVDDFDLAEHVADRDLVRRADAALRAVPDREEAVVRLTLQADWHLREVGECLGVTESRACQLRSLGLRRVRESLGAAA
jgi:RNA polymerase sigma factor (sigma-70 family)